MKRITLVLLLISAGIYAQSPKSGMKGSGPNHEKMKAIKTAHITQELDLTSAEAEKFWPIYNKFDLNLMELRKQMRSESMGKIQKGNIYNLTDEEANAIINKMLEMKTTELEYRKKLVKDLQGVIPPTKIIRLHKAEESFKRMLLERLKQKRKMKEKEKPNNKK